MPEDRLFELGEAGEHASRRLLAAARIGSHLEPVLVLTTAEETRDELRRRLQDAKPEFFLRTVPDRALEEIQQLVANDGTTTKRRVLWVEGSQEVADPWKLLLAQFNRLREWLHDRVPWLLVLAGPLREDDRSLHSLCARHAPDFYSIAIALVIRESPKPLAVEPVEGALLRIRTDPKTQHVELLLVDAAGAKRAFHTVDLDTIPISERHALFDLRSYLLSYVEKQNYDAEMARLGVVIANKVMGQSIFSKLWPAVKPRTLRIELPAVNDPLALRIASIPWELARPEPHQESLAERQLLVQMVQSVPLAGSKILPFADELRVLFVFAEAHGLQPLGVRQERLELIELFEKKIYLNRRVVAHFLSHGVTRERLEEQIRHFGGFHVVHWRGHGGTNLLELCQPGGKSDYLSGEQLLELFIDAGGYVPQLVTLSAAHSGEIAKVTSWQEFLAALKGDAPAVSAENGLASIEKPSFLCTAYSLVKGGIPAVVAMRFAVGDEYARELTKLFYEHLLADTQTKPPAEALTQARNALLKANDRRFIATDHAAPLLYGDADLKLVNGRSLAVDGRRRRIRQVGELVRHNGFVGRTWELAGLGSDFIGTAEKPIAQIVGLGGMGKTALAAEVLDLWEDRFDWVVIYQGKPNALAFDATLRDIHLDLVMEYGVYAEHITQHRADAIWRNASPDFQGDRRHQRMISNLTRALEHERILLVFDNFETALKPHSENDAAEVWACLEPAWDACFAALADKLRGTGSRVLVTTRYPLASLAKGAHQVVLGPLPYGEAALFVRQNPQLSRILFGDDEIERVLVSRVLHASRFHPLLMDRLAKLAVSPELRPQLLAALETLEKKQDYADLPDLFGAAGDAVKESAYLRDALESSLDLLLHESGPDARRLLWVIALMNQPETLGLLRMVWAGEAQQLRRVDLDPLLRRLVGTGLVKEERDSAGDQNRNLACHELVREHIRMFMEQHPLELGGLTANTVRVAYAEHLAATFRQLLHQDGSRALAAGSRALIYCVDAKAWDQLGRIAREVTVSTSGSRFFGALLPHLQRAADAASNGKSRWTSFTHLANALRRGGQADVSIQFFEEAADAARLETTTCGEAGSQALRDLAWITGHWAFALRDVGQLPQARAKFLESAEKFRQAGRPALHVLGMELEAARITVRLGHTEEVLLTIETGVERVKGWWRRHRAGEDVAEAPSGELLAGTLVGVLDVAREAYFARKDWTKALITIDSVLEVKKELGRPAEDIAVARMSRANALRQLGRFVEASTELEICLKAFVGDRANTAKTFSSLANLLAVQGDVAQAIVQERRAFGLFEHLPDPQDRAMSHHNLAVYLEREGKAAYLAESRLHQLAALVYRLAAGLQLDLEISARVYTVDFLRVGVSGQRPLIPRLAELLADPAFAPLAHWLKQRDVNVEELQSQIDAWLAKVREDALASKGSTDTSAR